MSDFIDRLAAIDALEKEKPTPFVNKDGSIDPFGAGQQNQWYRDGIAIMNLPSAQPEIKCVANVTLTDEQVKEAFEKAKCEILAVQREQQWIPCSERLPEDEQAVLVALDGGSMTDGVRSVDHAGRSVWNCALDNRTWYDDENIVLAWMPLPEPWRGDD